MEEEFVPYKLSLELKILGLELKYYFRRYNINTWKLLNPKSETYTRGTIVAPLWQQAFEWFRKNYGYEISLHKLLEEPGYMASIGWEDTEGYESQVEGDSYEKTRESCLKKLIELVKENGD